MKFRTVLASLVPRQWTRRVVPWVGGLLIGVIVALAGYDIVRGYQAAIDNTGRELDAQARVIAEQTARSLQAVDVVLRHLAEQFRAGTLSALSDRDLRIYLQEQAVGLVQIDGLLIVRADGTALATSYADPAQESALNVSRYPPFQAVQSDQNPGVVIGDVRQSATDQTWVLPIVRRLDSQSGEFAGAVAARGRIDYFQQFYRDVRMDPGTKITLMHQNGTLVARYPPAESALGKYSPLFDEMVESYRPGDSKPTRTFSPLDGVERFGALQAVPDYPLTVLVTRDVAPALAPWREQAIGTAIRTLALSALAALLLAIVMRQLSRLHAAGESLQTSQERFSVAVA